MYIFLRNGESNCSNYQRCCVIEDQTGMEYKRSKIVFLLMKDCQSMDYIQVFRATIKQIINKKTTKVMLFSGDEFASLLFD